MSTIAEIVKQVRLNGEHISVTEVDLVADHAIYSKLLEVLTLTNDIIAKSMINLRIGDFHTACVFLAVIGKRFEESGLSDLIVEARILGPTTVYRALCGKHYNNGVLAFGLVFDAFMRAKIDCLTEWIHTTEKNRILNEFLESQIFQNVNQLQNSKNLSSCIETMSPITDWMEDFHDMISNPDENGPNSVFWMSLLRMLQTFFNFQKSIKTGGWLLHLQSTAAMLPWMHAYDRQNYSLIWPTAYVHNRSWKLLIQTFTKSSYQVTSQ